ncbi:hypothetical protein CPB85DRAFT_387948 [Mucidula mucida]|nr:hypothetical protein CPB85DRAFT_387948 [Mucidula mucida]
MMARRKPARNWKWQARSIHVTMLNMDHHQQEVNALIDSLPCLGKDQIPIQDSCPYVCCPFPISLTKTLARIPVSPSSMVADTFSVGRSSLTEWIRTMHGSCPTCRNVFLSIRPPSESDDESSDGGEYIPEDDDEDFFMGTDEMEIDDFEDVDDSFGGVGDLEPIDLDDYRDWEWQDQEDMGGLTDGESESSPSEGDMSWNDGDNAVIADDVDIVESDNEGAESIPSDLGRATEEEETK